MSGRSAFEARQRFAESERHALPSPDYLIRDPRLPKPRRLGAPSARVTALPFVFEASRRIHRLRLDWSYREEGIRLLAIHEVTRRCAKLAKGASITWPPGWDASLLYGFCTALSGALQPFEARPDEPEITHRRAAWRSDAHQSQIHEKLSQLLKLDRMPPTDFWEAAFPDPERNFFSSQRTWLMGALDDIEIVLS